MLSTFVIGNAYQAAFMPVFMGVFNMCVSSSEERQETKEMLHCKQSTVTVAE